MMEVPELVKDGHPAIKYTNPILRFLGQVLGCKVSHSVCCALSSTDIVSSRSAACVPFPVQFVADPNHPSETSSNAQSQIPSGYLCVLLFVLQHSASIHKTSRIIISKRFLKFLTVFLARIVILWIELN